MFFTFKKNNKRTKKPVNCFLHDDASAGYAVSTDLYCNKTLPNAMEWTLKRKKIKSANNMKIFIVLSESPLKI